MHDKEKVVGKVFVV